MSSRFSSSGRYSSTAFDSAAFNEGAAADTAMLNRCCQWPAWLDTDSPTVQRLKRILRSRLWKLLMIIFYCFLLFGSQIHHIWAPAQMKIYNILACVTLGFCVADMLLRILVEPDYFQFRIPSYRGNRLGQSNGATDNNQTCSFGSFLFWCDLLSTSMILYDISWINNQHFESKVIELVLDDHGFPTHDTDDGLRIRPNGVEVTLLVTVARCARMARFVGSRTVVDLSNRINWYWIVKHMKWFNPSYHIKQIKKRRKRARLEELGEMDESNSYVQTPTIKEKRPSWGVVQIGILAAVRAQAEAEAREAVESRKFGRKFVGSLKWPWQYFKNSQSDFYSPVRQVAAIKIQRAWRSHTRFETAFSHDGGSILGDLTLGDDSNSILKSNRSRPSDPLERGRSKRSVLASFAQMNAHAGGKLDKNDIKASGVVEREGPSASRFQSQSGKGSETQVGSDMRKLTGYRVAIGVLLGSMLTVLFTYTSPSTNFATTMIFLHNQTMNDVFRMDALYAARNFTAPTMYSYVPVDEQELTFSMEGVSDLQPRERVRYVVRDALGQESTAEFSLRDDIVQEAIAEIVVTLFVGLVWFFGVTAFAGPVSSLVVLPIERMVRLLGMLMMDPLGYQSTQKFKNFMIEEDHLIKTTGWTREVLRGMETSFLMSTILRIGSLMKVGFGSAGVEIIRNNLQKGQNKTMLILTAQGSTVSCIFLFSDIRQFTDATECLQEEVFVFTNRIAAVVHSICHSYGGAANKNIGDAFLLSWSLEDEETAKSNDGGQGRRDGALKATSNQADKALLSVIKICISLSYDHYYLEPLSETAKNKLKEKLKRRAGPMVQMGFGLHAGKAVQGAIGSQKKIDATYVSEAVERAEFLESSTKKYGLNMIMSGSFHRLLHPNTRRRCRKIDQLLIKDDDEDADEDDDEIHGELMELYTFDMDVAAIHRQPAKKRLTENETISDSGSMNGEMGRKTRKSDRRSHGSTRQIRNRRRSVTLRPQSNVSGSEEFKLSGPGGSIANESNQRSTPSLLGGGTVVSIHSNDDGTHQGSIPELVLPSGPALYSHNVWQSPDMKRIRDKFVQGLFFQKFQSGLQAFYNKDWDMAQQCFQTLQDNFDDGPSRYFLDQIKQHNGVPPKNFLEYGLA